MAKSPVFDQPAYQNISEARGTFLRPVLVDLQNHFAARTAVDVGCGIGYFSGLLSELGFQVLAVDGREENVQEARRRFPDITFRTGNVEDPAVGNLGKFDLVLCLGLLYHLENPFQALRNLHALTGKVLVLESRCIPQADPVMELLEEGPTEDQGLRHIAFYPSEACLVKMLYRAGFAFVYRFQKLPGHPEFRASRTLRRSRTILIACHEPLPFDYLKLTPEPRVSEDPWASSWAKIERPVLRAWRFLRKPWGEKIQSVRFRCAALFSGFPLPVRLPFGGTWLAWRDGVSKTILAGEFENAESRFVQRILRPGMTVLDIGAHHGFYTLLASHKVGPRGRVVAFEPSPRERRKLSLHLFLNRCKNVQLESLALGGEEGEAAFFQVNGNQTGCNSLRPPAVEEPTKLLRVSVAQLDSFLDRRRIERVDFIKMDVEGAELEVLRGSERLLARQPRPVVLAEVYDIRTQPWGYKARDIIAFLREHGYHWFLPRGEGNLEPVDIDREQFDNNFVAIPEERAEELRDFILSRE